MTEHDNKPRRGWLEHGPVWLSAMAAFITAIVVALGFFWGRSTAPQSQPQPNTAITTGAPTHSAVPVDEPTPSDASTPSAAAGTVLNTSTIDVPDNYTLLFGSAKPTVGKTDGIYHLYYSGVQYDSGGGGTFATLDRAPTYAACTASTRFTAYITTPDAGGSFCYIGRGLVVGITVKAWKPWKYSTLYTVTWQG